MKGVRWMVCLMVFTGCICSYMLRINIDFAIVQMVSSNSSSSAGSSVNQYDWTPKERAWVLGSFFYGYILLQIPGGRLSERIGTKTVLGWSMGLSAIISLCTPLLASWSPWVVVAVRILQGLVTSPTMPSLSPLTIKWSPQTERAKFVSISQSGGTIGPVITYPLCGVIMDNLGWDKVFYFTGALALVWCLLWYFLVTDDPSTHPWITSDEIDHIMQGRGGLNFQEKDGSNPDGRAEPSLLLLLWKIVSTPYVWVCVACEFAYCWGLYAILVLGPTYMDEVIVEDGDNKFTKNALLTILPFIATSICCQIFGFFSDVLISRNILSPIKNQKLFVTLTMFPPAVCLLIMAFFSRDPIFTIVLITIGFAFNGAVGSGHIQNVLLLAPNRAGTFMGLSNGFGNISGALTPLVASYIVYDSGLDVVVGWRVFFATASVFYLAAWVIFILFAGDRQQPFDTYYVKKQEEESLVS